MEKRNSLIDLLFQKMPCQSIVPYVYLKTEKNKEIVFLLCKVSTLSILQKDQLRIVLHTFQVFFKLSVYQGKNLLGVFSLSLSTIKPAMRKDLYSIYQSLVIYLVFKDNLHTNATEITPYILSTQQRNQIIHFLQLGSA